MFIAQFNEIETFRACYERRLPLMLKGPTGCGKSQLVEFMAAELNLPLFKVACNEDTNAADLLGRYLLKGGETEWADGPVTRAAREGGLLYLDEIAEAREDVIVALHPMTDHRRELYLDKRNELIKAHKNFFVVASFNPGYQKGIKEIKPSTRQRFVSLALSYLPTDKEALLLQEQTGLGKPEALKLSQFAEKLRSSDRFHLTETVSTRSLIYAAHLRCSGLSLREACHQAIAETLSDDRSVVEALKDFMNMSF